MPDDQEERRYHERRDLPEFEIPVDIEEMSQDQINQFLVNQIVALRRDLKPFSEFFSASGRVFKFISIIAIFVGVLWSGASALGNFLKHFSVK